MLMNSVLTIGVSLKMYFGHGQTRQWSAAVAELARSNTAISRGEIEFFVIPSYLSILPTLQAFEGTGALIGAQDVATEDAGAFTGEVSALELAELGVRVVEVGHAERRRLFGETDMIVASKTAAALRNGLVPVLCIGETESGDTNSAVDASVAQLLSALVGSAAGRVIVAYEPVWAIGAPAPASAGHIVTVVRGLRAALAALNGREGSVVIYGGSAGPGLLTDLGDGVDGLFLGRLAHEPASLGRVLDEAASLLSSRSRISGTALSPGSTRTLHTPLPGSIADHG